MSTTERMDRWVRTANGAEQSLAAAKRRIGEDAAGCIVHDFGGPHRVRARVADDAKTPIANYDPYLNGDVRRPRGVIAGIDADGVEIRRWKKMQKKGTYRAVVNLMLRSGGDGFTWDELVELPELWTKVRGSDGKRRMGGRGVPGSRAWEEKSVRVILRELPDYGVAVETVGSRYFLRLAAEVNGV